jgi:ribosome-binding protein aMBF1 (putative translation factor)
MAVEKFHPRDYRLMEDESMALHESVSKTLKRAREQVALSRKTVSETQDLMARIEQTLQDLAMRRAER